MLETFAVCNRRPHCPGCFKVPGIGQCSGKPQHLPIDLSREQEHDQLDTLVISVVNKLGFFSDRLH